MKKLLTLLILSVLALSAMADDLVMQIQKVDGQRLFVYLEDQPLVSFSEGKLVVQTTKETISLPLSTVKKYTFESVQDGIENLRNTEVVIKRDGEILTITGLDKKSVIGVFASSGKLMKNITANDSFEVKVSFHDFPAGVYVLNIDGANYKFTKK